MRRDFCGIRISVSDAAKQIRRAVLSNANDANDANADTEALSAACIRTAATAVP